MVRINGNAPTNVKADTIDLSAQETYEESVDVQSTQSALEEALAEMQELRNDYSEYFTEEMEQRFMQMEMLMKSQKVSFEAFETMGYLPGGDGATAADINWTDTLPEAPMGLDGNLKEFADGEYDTRWDSYGDDLAGVYGVIDSAGSASTPLIVTPTDEWAQELTGDPNATIIGVDGETVEDSLVLTVKIDVDGTVVEKKVVLQHAATTNCQIVINATQMERGVECDFSRAVLTDRQGNRRGIDFVGSEHDDKIVGTTGNDVITGGAGNDEINGWFGDDILNGDAPDGSNEEGGDDILLGGAGHDTIVGGGGWDTHFESDEGEGKDLVEGNATDDISGATPGIGFTSGSNGWTAVEQDGYVEITNDGSGPGEIVLTTPQDTDGTVYNYAQGEVRGNDLVITYAGEGPDGEMRTFTVVIKDAMKHTDFDTLRIKLIGSDGNDVIDMGNIDAPANVAISIEGGDGNDVIFGAGNDLSKLGLEGDLSTSDVAGGHSTLNNVVDNDGVIVDEENFSSKYEADYDDTTGRIDITLKPAADLTGDEEDDLYLIAPEGYDRAFIAEDPSNADTYYVVMVNETTGERIVFELNKNDVPMESVIVGHISEELHETDTDTEIVEKFGPAITLEGFSLEDGAYAIDGGAGADVLIGYNDFVTDNDDTVLELEDVDEFSEEAAGEEMI